MERLGSDMGYEIVEEEWPDFRGRIFKNRPCTVYDVLSNTAAEYPDKIGFICDDRRMTFKECSDAVDRIARGLKDRKVGKGDHIALLMGIGIDFVLVFFAAQKLGAIAVPLNTRFKGEELAYEINDSECKVLFIDEEYRETLDPVRSDLKTLEFIVFNGAIPPPTTLSFSDFRGAGDDTLPAESTKESDAAVIVYTSGTTGKPKGAVLHHRGMVAIAMLIAGCLEPESKPICCVPLFHVTGIAMTMLASIFGAVSCVYMRNFKTSSFLQLIATEKVTHYSGVPNIIWLAINHPDFEKYDFSHFKSGFFGGAAATEDMLAGMVKKLPNFKISHGYGLTECNGTALSSPFEHSPAKPASVGKVNALLDAKIVDADGEEVPCGSTGEIMIRGATVMSGYWKKPEATKTTITPDGWLHTGDIGKVDEDGDFFIMDRLKDMINRAGEKVYCLELENVLMSCPAVLEATVVGVPDAFMGEVVKACIVLRAGRSATAEEIRDFCSQHLADYKVPKYVEFMSELPKNPSGKVVKNELKYVPATEDMR